MNNMIYVDPALLKGGVLRSAYFVKEFDESWVIQSEAPGIKNIDLYEKLPENQVLQMYPELEELFALEPGTTVTFRKGVSSGKWYDFK